ncbi:MAG: YraN family protein [Melioribacter sp.]|nr:YraN family protein [Melioribacter sp.]
MINKRKRGKEGEELACKYLTELGYKILKKNYQLNHGEIDIIAEDGDTLVFVEVKYRKSIEYGHPEDSITKRKQKQIKKTAEAYIYKNNITNQSCRIDVISILHLPDKEPEIIHYKNAF